MECSLSEIIKLMDYCKANNVSHIKWGSFEAVIGAQGFIPESQGFDIRSLTEEEILTGFRDNKGGQVIV
jgi:hypothetical protein